MDPFSIFHCQGRNSDVIICTLAGAIPRRRTEHDLNGASQELIVNGQPSLIRKSRRSIPTELNIQSKWASLLLLPVASDGHFAGIYLVSELLGPRSFPIH